MLTTFETLDLATRSHQRGDLAKAESLYRQILLEDPQHAVALHMLSILGQQAFSRGNSFKEQGRPVEATQCYRQALSINPDHAEAHNNLGNVLKEQGLPEEAATCYRQALRLNPSYVDAHNNLGVLLKDQGRLAEAELCYRQALALSPNHADVHYNLARALEELDQFDAAAQAYRQALRLNPAHVEARNNLGIICQNQGQIDDAIACFRAAVQERPGYVTAHSNLIYALHYSPAHDAASILAEGRRWDQRHAQQLAKIMEPPVNERASGRRLRIGYVSPDLCSHPVGRFLLPLLKHHDREHFEIFCYSAGSIADSITGRCRELADSWRPISGISDEEAARQIRYDRIDILVDLAMHTANNRLLVFARRPAAVQVTYLAYCGTTGLGAMDYRLSDPYLDPLEQKLDPYSEQTIRLPESFWCFQPVLDTPAPAVPPERQAGHVTFGCLNNFAKLSAPALKVWRDLLQVLPQARLLLFAPRGSPRDRVRDFFAQRDIQHARLSFVDRVPLAEYLKTYESIDIALDPFPYGGGTTSCEALWMGAPVISLAGQTAVGRGGLSILSNLGLGELVAHSPEQYIQLAADLANDASRLGELRASLRERMQSSPLMDGSRFTRNVEAAYRKCKVTDNSL